VHLDADDNCPDVDNAAQVDSDSDGLGNACDNCPDVANAGQEDDDSDNVGNLCDNCPSDANADQVDGNFNGIGNVCDPDCSSDDECTHSWYPLCDIDTGDCVACLGDEDCEAGLYCSVDKMRCELTGIGGGCDSSECSEMDGDLCTIPGCFGGRCAENAYRVCPGVVCDPSTGDCFECSEDTHCSDPANPVCNEAGVCIECLEDSHCVDDDAFLCNTVQCNTSFDGTQTTGSCEVGPEKNCTFPSPYSAHPGTIGTCNPETHECVQCLTSADCPSGGDPACIDNTCRHCNPMAVPRDCPVGKSCNPIGGLGGTGGFFCTECYSDNQCGGGVCTSMGFCTECQTNADCEDGDGDACTKSRCDAITLNGRFTGTCVGVPQADCVRPPVCHRMTGECAECNFDSECESGKICDFDTCAEPPPPSFQYAPTGPWPDWELIRCNKFTGSAYHTREYWDTGLWTPRANVSRNDGAFIYVFNSAPFIIDSIKIERKCGGVTDSVTRGINLSYTEMGVFVVTLTNAANVICTDWKVSVDVLWGETETKTLSNGATIPAAGYNNWDVLVGGVAYINVTGTSLFVDIDQYDVFDIAPDFCDHPMD
ncbi:MAG: hypothetical protein GY847_37720, partial [Proteobacteria bacterium]|nr:hypothetical protein [Pseudomonadota bacterium]